MRCELRPSGIQSFEDLIDGIQRLRTAICRDDGGLKERVIHLSTLRVREVYVGQPLELLGNVLEGEILAFMLAVHEVPQSP